MLAEQNLLYAIPAYRPFLSHFVNYVKQHRDAMKVFGRLPHLNTRKQRIDTEEERIWKQQLYGLSTNTASTPSASSLPLPSLSAVATLNPHSHSNDRPLTPSTSASSTSASSLFWPQN